MVKYLIKKKVEKEAEHIKKVMIYSGVALVGVGAYVAYKSIKKQREQCEDEDTKYIQDKDIKNAYEDISHIRMDGEVEAEVEIRNTIEDSHARIMTNEVDKALEENKVRDNIKHINSRRIIDENCEDIDQKKISEKINDMKEEKGAINIADYKEEQYDKYEYMEDDLNKDK